MLHEISPHCFNNKFISTNRIGEQDYIFHYSGNSFLLKNIGDSFELPRKKDFREISEITEKIFLFTLDETPCFLINDELKADDSEFVYKEISFFRTIKQQEIAWVSITGYHLANWYSHNKFCGNCGSRTHQKADERAIICPECNSIVYPKISPAVIVAILSDDKILLARNAAFPGKWFSLLAGYVDIGESLEEALKREVKEEVGLEINNIRYYKSQPWPFSGSLMIGFIAEADDSQPIVSDEREIAEAAWFTRGNLPEHPLKLSIAGEMIEKFENGSL